MLAALAKKQKGGNSGKAGGPSSGSKIGAYHNSMAIGEIMCNMREKINKSISSYEKELL